MRYAVATATIFGLLLAGCAAPAKQEASRPATAPATQPVARQKSARRLTISDPCPSQLHDLAGALLLYFQQNRRLPEGIEELQQLPGFGSVRGYACPESNKPYAYNPRGVVGPNIIWRAVIYDAEPSHFGYRWVIAVQEPLDNAPLITDVQPWPESRFPKAPSGG